MKKQVLLAVLMLLPLMASADAIEINGIYYNLNAEDKTAEVTQNPNKYSSEVTIPNSVTYGEVIYSVTSIGEYAFDGCIGLTSVTIPNSVTSILFGAFESCSSLTSLTIPNSVASVRFHAFDGTAWYNNQPDGLVYAGSCAYKYKGEMPNNTTVSIKEGTTCITDGAFDYCNGLTSITIPNSLTFIGNAAFNGCSGLTSVTIPNSVASIGSQAFIGCSGLTSVTIPNSVTSIGEHAFQNCSGLTSITIPNSVTSIGWGTFSGCSNLTSVTIPNSVTSIGDFAFCDCSALTSITIPNSVTFIGEDAFNACSGLTSITIPNSVTSIGEDAFYGCSGLTSIVVEEGNSSYDSRGNCNAIIETASNALIAGCKNTKIPTDVTFIGDFAFCYCGLTSITIPNSVTSIGEHAFDYCSGLTSITIPNSVTSIGNSTFRGCSSLASILLPNSVTNVGDFAFSDCSSLTSITIPNSVTSIGENAFENCTGLSSVFISDLTAWCNIHFGMPSNFQYYSNPLYYASHLFLNGVEIHNLVIPDDVSSISGGAFAGYSGLTSVSIPTSVKNIGKMAFFNCYNLTTMMFPDDLSSIEENAFHGTAWFNNQPDGIIYAGNVAYSYKGVMSDNTEIVIKDGTFRIAPSAFLNCEKMTSIIIPPSVTYIDRRAFQSCTGLTSVCISDLEAWCKIKFDGYYDYEDMDVKEFYTSNPLFYAHHLYLNGEEIRNLIIPNSVSSINDFAFYGCNNLISVTTPHNVTSIGDLAFALCHNLTFVCVEGGNIKTGAFFECSNLTSVKIGNAVNSISGYAFSSCFALTSVSLGETINYIGSRAFSGSSNLTDVYCYAKEIPAKAGGAFGRYTQDAVLHVPVGCVDAYKALAPWNQFKEIVEFEAKTISIGSSGKASYCGDKSLDFSFSEEIKAYIATGFDKDAEIIWLTRVKDVPAGTPVLIKGVAEKTYDVPVTDSENSYYTNMFKGNISGETIQINETDGDKVNYYLTGDGTFKSVKGYANIGNNKSYLQLPGTFAPAEAGATQTVTVGSAGKASFAAPVDLDFTNVEGLKAFSATGYDKSSKTIWLTRVMKVQKGEGVLLKGNAKDYEIPSAAVQSSYMNMFVGNTSGASVQVQATSADGSKTNFYLKGDGTFVSVNGYVNIGNNKCYLELPTNMVAGAASTRGAEAKYILEEPEIIKLPISFRSLDNDGDGTTAIRNLTPALSEGEGAWYTLQGQRVAKPGKGLYIKNGKKVVIK